MNETNLWHQIGNLCLTRAQELLKDQTAPIELKVAAISTLVDTALAIDGRDLQWNEYIPFRTDK